MIQYRIRFITPLFSYGSYNDSPEIRPSSIRGQLHWWFRALGGNHAQEKQIFGGIHNGTQASKIVIRVANEQYSTGDFPTLPHKQHSNSRRAIKPNSSFDLLITERQGGFSPHLKELFEKALHAWLFFGTLGLRSTRASGSFTWTPISSECIPYPDTIDKYSKLAIGFLENAPLKAAFVPDAFSSAEEARKIISDTIGGHVDHQSKNDLEQLNFPLGKIGGQRKTSPLRFRIMEFSNKFYIVAIWDNRNLVTGNSENDLENVIKLLIKSGKKIGTLLHGSHPIG